VVLTYLPRLVGAPDGTGLIFFLIVLIGIIASLLKKASQTSRRSTLEGPPRPRVPGVEPGPERRLPTISEFLKRIREISEQAERPPGAPETGIEEPPPRPFLRTPAPPRRPAAPYGRAARRTTLPQPSLKAVKGPQVSLQPEPVAGVEVPIGEPLEVRLEPLVAAPPPPAAADAYIITASAMPPIPKMLGGRVSTSEIRKGIILAEILGRPVALRRRRAAVRRREKAGPSK